MIKSKMIMVVCLLTAVLMLIFRMIGFSLMVAWIISGVLLMFVGLMYTLHMHKKRTALLLEQCDPYQYIEETQKQMELFTLFKRDKAIFEIQLAVGYIEVGETQKALETLKRVDKSELSPTDNTLLSYNVTYLSCLYQMGEIEEAEKMFETQMALLVPTGNRMKEMMNIFLLERLFYLGKHDECKNRLYSHLENVKFLNTKLNIQYMIAVMEEASGNKEKAISGYNMITEMGNKLNIVIQSKERLAELTAQ